MRRTAKIIISIVLSMTLFSTTAFADVLPKGNARRNMVTVDSARQKQSLKLDVRHNITISPNGRNLAVPEGKANADKNITIRTLPEVWHTPDTVLDLPDDGKELEELIPAPQSVDDQAIKESVVRDVKQNSRTVSKVNYLKIYGSVTPDEYNDFLIYLNRVIEEDSVLVQSAVDKGWTIVLTEYDLDDLLFDGDTNGVEGCTYFPSPGEPGTIFIHAGKYSYCVIHEFGHVLDCLCDFPSQQEEFKAIFEDEAGSLTEYAQSSPLEFFAEIYLNDMLQPETTEIACPNACEFLRKYHSTL